LYTFFSGAVLRCGASALWRSGFGSACLPSLTPVLAITCTDTYRHSVRHPSTDFLDASAYSAMLCGVVSLDSVARWGKGTVRREDSGVGARAREVFTGDRSARAGVVQRPEGQRQDARSLTDGGYTGPGAVGRDQKPVDLLDDNETMEGTVLRFQVEPRPSEPPHILRAGPTPRSGVARESASHLYPIVREAVREHVPAVGYPRETLPVRGPKRPQSVAPQSARAVDTAARWGTISIAQGKAPRAL